jgi:hypothetical protein
MYAAICDVVAHSWLYGAESCEYAGGDRGHFRCFGIDRFSFSAFQHSVEESGVEFGGAKVVVAQYAPK